MDAALRDRAISEIRVDAQSITVVRNGQSSPLARGFRDAGHARATYARIATALGKDLPKDGGSVELALMDGSRMTIRSAGGRDSAVIVRPASA